MTTVAIGWIAAGGIGILGILILACWVLGLADIFSRPDFDRGKKSAWVLIVVLLPIVGTGAYFLMRPTLPAEAEQAARAATKGRNF
jgi:hypothetical protein